MPANTIVHRVFEFMKGFPPFSLMNEQKLMEIAGKVKISYVDRGQLIFKENDPPEDYFYLVKEGTVSLSLSNEVVDICDEGDLFGVRSMLTGKPYVLQAETTTEALLYLIPIGSFKPILENNGEVALYFASGLASGQTIMTEEKIRPVNKYSLKDSPEILGSLPKPKNLICCKPNDTIKSAAMLMDKHHIGSLIITDESGRPVGIITDTDLRREVATGKHGIEELVSDIMNSPVVTVSPDSSLMDMTVIMINKGIHHLCITEDGTAQSKAIGVCSERDLLLAQGNHPAIIVKEICKTDEEDRLSDLRDKAENLLRQYFKQGISIVTISRILSSINDALIKKAINLAEAAAKHKFEDPKLKYCWLSLGSEGREEQLLRTDVDNAILYEDAEEDKKDLAKQYFLYLGEYVNNILVKCGFQRCPANIMASNPECCLSLSEWKAKFHRWITSPDAHALMNSTIFFDFRAVDGAVELASSLQEYLIEAMDQESMFINHLASNALQNPPPLTFFKNIMVEKSGEHKDEFDIKARAMMPLADAARLLLLSHKETGIHNTSERFKRLATLEPKQKHLFEEASMAYLWLSGLRTRFGLENNDSGRFLPIKALNKLEKQMLRNTFIPIKEIQKLLEVRFQLDYLRS